jgi:hypothetical protein
VRALALVITLASAVASAAPVDDLGSSDPKTIAAAIDTIERAPGNAETLFAAARAADQTLGDPALAARLYERVAHDFPDASVAMPASRRGEQLRDELGPHDEYAAQTRAFAQLIARAGTNEDEIARDATALADQKWPGAADVLLWETEYLCARGAYDRAQATYATLHARYASSPQAIEGMREATSCALEAKNWALAHALAKELPGGNPVEDATKEALLSAAARGLRRETFGTAAYLALALALLVLLASLADASLRGGRRWPRLRPPIEAMFLAPLAVVFFAIAFAAQRVIAPAVARIMLTGLVLAWISGATLDLLRMRGRPSRARSLVQVAACLLGVVAIAYIALVRDGLLDMLLETAKYGPEP